MGYPSGTQGTQLLDWSRQRDSYVGLYFQDDWKVTPRLTLNFGVRYELYTQPIDARDRGGLFDARTCADSHFQAKMVTRGPSSRVITTIGLHGSDSRGTL